MTSLDKDHKHGTNHFILIMNPCMVIKDILIMDPRDIGMLGTINQTTSKIICMAKLMNVDMLEVESAVVLSVENLIITLRHVDTTIKSDAHLAQLWDIKVVYVITTLPIRR